MFFTVGSPLVQWLLRLKLTDFFHFFKKERNCPKFRPGNHFYNECSHPPQPLLKHLCNIFCWKKVKVNFLNNIILCRHSLSSEPLCQLFIDHWTVNIIYWSPGLPRLPGVPKPSILVVLGVLGVLESWSPVTVHGPGLPRLPGLPKPVILTVLGLLGILGVLASNNRCLEFNGQWTTDIKALKKVSGDTKWCYSECSLSLFSTNKYYKDV